MRIHTNKRIAERLFYFFRKDLRTLRSKIRYIDEDIVNARISKMTRREMVQKLVEHEVGKEEVKNYLNLCVKWNNFESLCLSR